MSAQSHFRTKRVFESAEASDGMRVLVDRMWPRGLRKEDAHIDIWLKDIAPSPALRQWFGHDPSKWEEFKQRYLCELKENDEQVWLLKQEIKKGALTLVYAAKDTGHNEALVLQEFLSS